ncbi:hypothetical protein JY651_48015 [Pyxidicoccus parkwayensis]|uniref:T4 bacteriophage base plate protein n=1 Tax=Pyxidicoccus parkwayensis TaxID=2813578 RepID=A0ABX7NZ55_9BACT|nr:hypothetical protein [Pyxidicoccus parkwaysis]QSQ22762.1 hypothetical protein JY651_48015 [Pyxidicoccus parkwaysis]
MLLPGGLLRAGTLRRGFRFREPDGVLELGLAELAREREPVPRKVSRVLAAALEHVAGEPVGAALAGELCVADRQFLMRELERLLGLEQPWRTVVCGACGERFDFELRASRLPVKEAGEGFPFAEVETGQGRVRVRVPTGADQEAVVEAGRADELSLLARCLAPLEAPGWDVARLEAADVRRLDEALEAVAPAVVTRVRAACVACGGVREVEVAPYGCLSLDPEALLEEVHTLASRYHWSERDILALPRHRRRKYLRLVERDAGVTT